MAVAEDSDDDIPLFGPDPRLPFPRLPDPASGGDDASDASIVAPPPVAPPPFYFPAPFPAVVDEMVAESDDEDEAMQPLIPDDNDENEYDHIDNRAIDVTLDMPSANPNIMNVTSRHQEKYANLSW